MKLLFFFVAALAAAAYAEKYSPPKVQVYSKQPGLFGQNNVLICYVSGFHPPDLSIQLLEDQKEMKGTNQTDLAFKGDWRFHLTKSVAFVPSSGHQYSCKVTHGRQEAKTYVWDHQGLLLVPGTPLQGDSLCPGSSSCP
ncbi:beta-2-microglobulin-like isoform X2 [Nelusetta ayraudi]|uniref:beta-2-microglobulin-like isoform X2 n=1 Tax=Nelusetta ayraudi TaxID=303726 RepID=UPI003F71983A